MPANGFICKRLCAKGIPDRADMNKQGEMKLIHVNDTIMEIFDVTGFPDILTIE